MPAASSTTKKTTTTKKSAASKPRTTKKPVAKKSSATPSAQKAPVVKKTTKKSSEIQNLTVGELHTAIEEKKKELHTLKMKNALKSLQQPHLITGLKKEIARLSTLLTTKKYQHGSHRN